MSNATESQRIPHKQVSHLTENATPAANSEHYQLAGTISPWTTFSEGMADIEKGYSYYRRQYKKNYSAHLPENLDANILVVSAGPGYFVSFLNGLGYKNVLGIDSEPKRVVHATNRNLNVIVAHAFDFISSSQDHYEMIVLEQEINHLTRDEFLDFLSLAKNRLLKGGKVILNATNFANPITTPEHIGHNLNHLSAWTSNSLRQAFSYAGYESSKCYPLDNYVLYENPLNWVAKGVTGLISLLLRITFMMYGKSEAIFTKRLVAVGQL